LHPFQALVFDVSARAPDDSFLLPPTPEVVQRDGLQSARVPSFPDTRSITLDDALRQAPSELLALQQLPDTSMRGMALAIDQRDATPVAMLYEGEFQSIMLLPNEIVGYNRPAQGEERSAGTFRYRILPDFVRQSFGLAAQVYRPETPEKWVLLLLV